MFAGVRRDADADSLREAGSERLVPLILDVTDPAQIDAAAARVAAETGGAGLDGLVNNAGIAVPGPLETIPIEDFRRQIEVNLSRSVAVTQALLPAIREARGRIVFISSIGGRIAFPMNGAYHAAKFGIEAMGDVFRQELRPWGISVSIVEPGSIATPIWERGDREAEAMSSASPDTEKPLRKALEASRRLSRQTGERGIPPERVASTIEHALTAHRPRARYLVGADAKVQARLRIVIPTRVLGPDRRPHDRVLSASPHDRFRRSRAGGAAHPPPILSLNRLTGQSASCGANKTEEEKLAGSRCTAQLDRRQGAQPRHRRAPGPRRCRRRRRAGRAARRSGTCWPAARSCSTAPRPSTAPR